MKANNKIKTSLPLTVVFVLVTFAIPMILHAGPPSHCPCYTVNEVMRFSHPPEAVIIAEMNHITREASTETGYAAFALFSYEEPSGGLRWYCEAWVEDYDTGVIFSREQDYIHENEAGVCYDLLYTGIRVPPAE